MLFRDRLNAVEQSPRIGRLKGRRTFETVLAVIVDAARALHRLLGTGRLQVQLRLLVATALFVGFLPFLRLGYSRGPLPETLIEPVFALLRSEEHTSELQSLMRISYAVFCLKKKNKTNRLT